MILTDGSTRLDLNRIDLSAVGVDEVLDHRNRQVDAGTRWGVDIQVGNVRQNGLVALLRIGGAAVHPVADGSDR